MLKSSPIWLKMNIQMPEHISEQLFISHKSGSHATFSSYFLLVLVKISTRSVLHDSIINNTQKDAQ